MKDAKFVRIDEDGRHVYRLPSVIHNVDIRIDISEDPEVIEVKTTDLIGPALDWAVMYAGWGDGPDWRLIDGALFLIGQRDVRVGMDGIGQQETITPFQPSTRWKDGGPLIVQYQVAIIPEAHDGLEGAEMSERWYANVYFNAGEEYTTEHCDTALIAACRAVVGTVFGDAVSVPKEMMQ